MAYQYVREPLRAQEADALSHACETPEEKLIIWTLIDTGLRVSELCSLTSQHVLWQQKALRIQGKGGPYGKRSKHRVVPMSRRIQPLMEHYFALHGLNPTSTLPGAISTAGPVQMKENSAFSFRIAHHRLVLRPQTSFPGGLGIPGDERYG